MAISRKILGKDERVILSLRTHAKALIVPVLALLAILAVAALAVMVVPDSWRPWSYWVIGIAAALGVVAWFVLPFLRWSTSTYTLTDRRIITRRGILNKTGHDVPLSRINNVTYDRSITDRVLGCGTLVFTTAAEEPLRLPDVPKVERVHVIVTELLFGNTSGAQREADEFEGRETRAVSDE
ncbi:PH domain-containing protein [Rarobacter incanus]|uniref:PH (Pleckstrin Homology) domain-containing protein n=1 Tax=Rarobacter incanus TaxID=153494 RepID=A0A542SPE3_9MICO|nr:PH domain-containing protein [Rarobacter incanus]TQK76486.1 PH (Pleckstrin Homology) domain-containing protein [Rarobacter incanus]